MNRPVTTLRIVSGTANVIDTVHLRVLAEDAEALHGVVAARAALVETQITRFVAAHRAGQALCEEALNLTLDALLELRNPGANRDKAIRHLELAAAMAITTINTLRKD